MTREEAIARIREHKIIHKMNEPRAIYISEALEMAIKALEQEPKTGLWIGIDEEPHEDWECDNCGFVIWADENIEKFHYCPNCGAKMVGSKAESEEK